jgi:hypothetical protein
VRQADCLEFLARRLAGFHVGGKAALAWRGVRHNLPAQEPLWLWGDQKTRLPEWFLERFRSRYTTRSPFGPALPDGAALQPLPENPDGVLVSVPERAMLELLSEVGVHQGTEEARHIIEGLRALWPDVLVTLLKHCPRVKVSRLCALWAEEFDLPWASAARKALAKKHGGSRWTARFKDGTTLILKP